MQANLIDSILNKFKADDCNEIISFEEVFSALKVEDVPSNCIENFGEILKCLMHKGHCKKDTDGEYDQWIFNSFESGKRIIKDIAMDPGRQPELHDKSFSLLVQILPLYVHFFNVKPEFPSQQYADLLEIIISSNGDSTIYCDILKEYMIYEDMRINFWKALDMAVHSVSMETFIIRNSLNLISKITSHNDKINQQVIIGPVQYYCGVKIGLTKTKDRGKHVQNVWKVLSSTDVPPDVRQVLLQTLLENMISRMDKPIFLTDYFMSSLQYGGSISILALQGIFTLIQKFNINYPNIYDKLYDMWNPIVFRVNYKSRLFFLTDVFLTSLHLPESLVAGFAKKFARLSLVAPPSDILTLLALITNLIVRHAGLSKLITNLGKHDYENDPYLSREKDPSSSRALESSLWEIKLIQNHILPVVSTAAMFIDNPLPKVERDLSDLLEGDSCKMFSREAKKKMINPSICFESPAIMKTEEGFKFWSF